MTRNFTDIGSEEAVTYMYTMEQSDYYKDISSDEEHHEKVQKKETDNEANVEAAVVPGPSENPSDNGLMMVVIVPSPSKDTENPGGQLQIVESACTSQLREDRDNDKDDGEPSCSGAPNDGLGGASAGTRGRVEVTSTINVLMQRRTVVYPDGFVDISRTTNFTFSEDIDPTRVDCEDLLRDILCELPLHFQNARRGGGDQ